MYFIIAVTVKALSSDDSTVARFQRAPVGGVCHQSRIESAVWFCWLSSLIKVKSADVEKKLSIVDSSLLLLLIEGCKQDLQS